MIFILRSTTLSDILAFIHLWQRNADWYGTTVFSFVNSHVGSNALFIQSIISSWTDNLLFPARRNKNYQNYIDYGPITPRSLVPRKRAGPSSPLAAFNTLIYHREKYVNIPSEKYIYVHIYVCICVYTYLCKMDERWSYASLSKKWMSTGLLLACHKNGWVPVLCWLVHKNGRVPVLCWLVIKNGWALVLCQLVQKKMDEHRYYVGLA